MWNNTIEETLTALKTTERGLSHAEAARRLILEGKNEIGKEKNIPGWKILFRQFTSPLVCILVGASVISGVLGDATETIIILGVVAASGSLAFLQEYRSERAVRLLRKKLTRRALVIREGKSATTDATLLVPGDIVEVDLGTVIAADLRLVSVEDLEIDESPLTGESVPVPKITDAIYGDRLPPQEQTNTAFAGTHVVQGSGIGVVINTGSNTELGKTASLINETPEETDFQKGIRQFGNFLLKVTLGLTLIVATFLGLIHGTWSESLLFALALAVGVSPELLPVIVTVNLSRGALHMSKKHVLVKRLISIEDLGNADVFCTDKTGTLTVGTPRVRGSVNPDGIPNDRPLALALNCIEVSKRGKATSALDEAILDAGHGGAKAAYPKSDIIDLISFDFSRRRMSCVVQPSNESRRLIVKGAVSEVIAQCTTRESENGVTELHEKDRKKLIAYADSLHDNGARLLAVAERIIEKKSSYVTTDEKELCLVGFVLISDAPKQTAKAALKTLKELNVRIVILTGDNERVTAFVASQLNFAVTGVYTGEQVEKMSDPQLRDAVENANIFAKITPAHKLRIIQALKKCGHTVGYMGDGVNDAPALHAADVGISFDDAIDVAKEAASVILLKKNLSVLADGIREGRRTFANMRTYIYSTISSNFGNMLSVAGASLLLPFIPLLPAQILLLNLLSDVPMLAISGDRTPEEEILQPKKWDIRKISSVMFFYGAISSFADYITFGILLFVAHANIPLFRTGWFIESMLTEIVIIFLLRTRRISIANRPGIPLIISSVLSMIITLIITQTRIGKSFEFIPVATPLILIILLIVAGYAGLTLLGKIGYAKLLEKEKHST
jgi:Mg2+-importing ATPase